jgi:hypothetical protein
MMSRGKSRWSRRTWRLHSLTKRAMPTIEEETFHSKLATSYTWRYHPREAPKDSRSKVNWHQDMSVPSKFWITREKWLINLSYCHSYQKCLWVPKEQIPMEQLDLGGDLSYSERAIRILDIAEWVTHSKVIMICKVQWSHHTKDEATWEHEE